MMSSKLEAMIEDLARLPSDQKAEIVEGRLVLMSPTGALHGYAASEVMFQLKLYARRTKLGNAFGDNVGFVVNLPYRKSFSPDAAFFTGKLTMKFADGAPLVAVEV